MVIESHNGLFFQNPLQGPPANFTNEFYFQPQFMEYDDFLRSVLKTAAANVDESSHIHEGTYTALMGRTYETKAESQALRALDTDAVGMSTVPEIITAANLGMETIAFSLITNVIDKDGSNKTSHEEVMAALKAQETRKRVHEVTKEFFRILNNAKWGDKRVIDLIIESKTRK